jgi:hypothetical protein
MTAPIDASSPSALGIALTIARVPYDAATAANSIEADEPEHKSPPNRGRFGKGNRFATREYRSRLQRPPHYYVQRHLRDTIGKLRTGRMAPGVGLALIAAFKLELELIDRTTTTATLEGLQHEIDRLQARIEDLLRAAAAGSPR